MTTDTMREVLQAAFDKSSQLRKQYEDEAADHDELARNNHEIAVTYALKMHEIAEAARKLGIELEVPAPREALVTGDDYVSVAK
jgi:hypothetical protein